MKLGNLAARVLTALVLVPGVLALIAWRRPEGVLALVFVATLLTLRELFAITLDDPAERAFGVGLGAASAIALVLWPETLVAILPVVVLAPALFFLFRHGELETVVGRTATVSFGAIYGGLMLSFLSLIKLHVPHGALWVVVALLIAWCGDTGAYFAGRALGKRKLYPAISPGKTWAGAVGGLLGAFAGLAALQLTLFPELGWIHVVAVSVIGNVLGQCGDLVESMIKRARKVKDSGHLLPGHGGMLDRIDALLFIAPFVYLYAAFLWR